MPKGRGNRERLLRLGSTLFQERGYQGAGVQEIADASAVPKGSFYNYFKSKEEFALEVLEHYQQDSCAELERILTGSGSPLDRLRWMLDAGIAAMKSTDFKIGCLAGRFTQEVAGQIPAFREPLERHFQCVRDHFARVLEEASRAGEIAEALDPRETAEFLVNAFQGAALRAKAAHSEAPLENFRRVVFDHLLRPSET
jgi:TetR/AcrR family transcriptional repressor of nem operon